MFVKRLYSRFAPGRAALVASHAPVYIGLRLARAHAPRRAGWGMASWNVRIDWLGDRPFERTGPSRLNGRHEAGSLV